MGTSGSHGPRPYAQRQASTQFLRVPALDWIAVAHGHKTEFRAAPNQVSQAAVAGLDLPTPVVAYRVGSDGRHDHRLMVLAESWMEPLGAISDVSLEREGFPDVAHFRRYWMGRTRRRFRPLQKVRVFVVRPFEPEDWTTFAETFMERLYGDFR